MIKYKLIGTFKLNSARMLQVILFLHSFFPGLSHSATMIPPQSKARLCTLASTLVGRKKLISASNQYRQTVENHGQEGFFRGGLCWWRSRINRAALYLTYYSPMKKRPTQNEAARLIDAIIEFKSVIEIPGFSTFEEFSKAYPQLLQQAEESWQLKDSFHGVMRTINPLRPTFYRENKNLFSEVALMDKMLNEYGSMPYVFLQVEGVMSHSWLIQSVVSVIGRNFGGYGSISSYFVTAIDPSVRGKVTFSVYPGDTQVSAFDFESEFIFEGTQQAPIFSEQISSDQSQAEYMQNILGSIPLYVDFNSDLDQISHAIHKSCSGFAASLYNEAFDQGTYQ